MAEAVETLSGTGECLVVVRGEKLGGMWETWDVLQSVAGRYDELAERLLAEVVRTDLVFVKASDSAATASSLVALSGYRHVLSLNSRTAPRFEDAATDHGALPRSDGR